MPKGQRIDDPLTQEERKAKQKAYAAEQRQKRRERINADPVLKELERLRANERARAWAKANPEKVRAIWERKYAKHKDRYREKTKQWFREKREWDRKRKRESYAANPEKERARNREFYARNRQWFIERSLIRRTGPERGKYLERLLRSTHRDHLSAEQFDELRARLADGPCEICGKNGRMCIDHCHARNIFRGILCDGCNRGIGFFKDNPALLRKAAAYLERIE